MAAMTSFHVAKRLEHSSFNLSCAQLPPTEWKRNVCRANKPQLPPVPDL